MFNPEFRRNLWLEITPHRLIGMPLVLGAMFLLACLLNDQEWGQGVANLALTLCGLISMLWGASLAAESILSEVRSHTWENQRMSAMSAWDMSWGKLLGATIYSWYGAAICLLVYLTSADKPFPVVIKVMLLFVLCGLFSQSIALVASLQILKKDRSVARSQATVYAVFGLMAAAPLLQLAFNQRISAAWYGITIDYMDFILISLVFYVAWAWVGIYHAMRSELQMQHGIWGWTLFVVWLMGYLMGFVDDTLVMRWGGVGSSRLLVACLVALLLTYLMIFVESKDPVIFLRLKTMFEQRNWQQISRTLPCWFITLLFAFMICMALAFVFPVGKGFESSLFFVALYLFVLRDVCIILWVNFSQQRKRADITAVLYLIVLYGLLPSITHATGLDILDIFFFPQGEGNAFMGTCIVAVQFVIVLWFAKKRWQSNYGVTTAVHE